MLNLKKYFIQISNISTLNLCKADKIKIFMTNGSLSKRPKIVFQDQLSLNAGQKCCRMLHLEHSAILLTLIKLPFVIKIFVLSIIECRFRQVLMFFKMSKYSGYIRSSLSSSCYGDHLISIVFLVP